MENAHVDKRPLRPERNTGAGLARAGSPAASGAGGTGGSDGSDAEVTLAIGALARLTGRTVHTIRWYEAQGLMPGVRRNSGGRRLYSARHVRWLQLMVRLRASGMSITQMQRYAQLVAQGQASLDQRRALLQAHRDEVVARIAEWQSALVLLDDKIDFYGRWISEGQRPHWPHADTPTFYAPPGRDTGSSS